jgi:hypothetical protein
MPLWLLCSLLVRLRTLLVTAFLLLQRRLDALHAALPACPLPAYPLQASGLVADLLGAAEQQQLHWRYRCLAEIALCMLLPLLDAASGAAVARHWTGGRWACSLVGCAT